MACLAKNNLGEDIVVHVDYEVHRLVIIDLEDDIVVHVDYVNIAFGQE